nr:MAG TPA: hypothetical protein [Caudoviricetes sp.]
MPAAGSLKSDKAARKLYSGRLYYIILAQNYQ